MHIYYRTDMKKKENMENKKMTYSKLMKET